LTPAPVLRHFILNDDGVPVVENDLVKWAIWFEENGQTRRRVGRDRIGPAEVSTVFLGLDHSFGRGSPVLWETMVFGGKLDRDQDRCAGNREQAEAMHAAMIARVCEAEGVVIEQA